MRFGRVKDIFEVFGIIAIIIAYATIIVLTMRVVNRLERENKDLISKLDTKPTCPKTNRMNILASCRRSFRWKIFGLHGKIEALQGELSELYDDDRNRCNCFCEELWREYNGK